MHFELRSKIGLGPHRREAQHQYVAATLGTNMIWPLAIWALMVQWTKQTELFDIHTLQLWSKGIDWNLSWELNSKGTQFLLYGT